MDVVRVLQENGIAPKKELDQFFIKDERVLGKEVQLAKLAKKDVVLEIGAGPGNLTGHIAKKCKVIAIEKDYSFRYLLKNIQNVNAIFGNALEILESLRKIREQKKTPPQFNKVISNVPYSITQDLIIELLQHQWSVAVLIVQKEFAQKLKANEKIALVVSDCCEISFGGDVPAGAFYPPAVDSAILVMEQKRVLDADFWEFLGTAYRDRNKNARNVIKNAPTKLASKKIHQLSAAEMKKLYEASKVSG